MNKTRGILKQLAINNFFLEKNWGLLGDLLKKHSHEGNLISGTTGNLHSLHALFHSDSD